MNGDVKYKCEYEYKQQKTLSQKKTKKTNQFQSQIRGLFFLGE